MRSEREMLELILEIARTDPRVRAVILNGSRANPDAPPDPFRDFDIVYAVTDVPSFRHDGEWLKRFGELMIMQLPDEMGETPRGIEEGFSFLMQFTDGNRIDLRIVPLAETKRITDDTLSILLLDKDGIVGQLPPATDTGYLPRPPTAKAFFDCCNEFWWLNPYIAKGLWRRQLPYAKFMLDQALRDELMKMVTWYVGVRTQFSRNPGAFGKYLQKYLEPELWDLLKQTYSDASYERTWEALFVMGQLFRKIALVVAAHFDYEYPEDDDTKVTAHLQHVRRLPEDAEEIY